MGTPRIASAIDLSVPATLRKAVSTGAALTKPIRISKETIQDHEELSNILTGMQLELTSSTAAQRSHPEQAPITFKNVVCGVSDTKVILPHNFGRNAEYIVTKWKGVGTTAMFVLVCDEDDAAAPGVPVVTDKNTLALRSRVAGIASIRVYPGA